MGETIRRPDDSVVLILKDVLGSYQLGRMALQKARLLSVEDRRPP